MHILQLVIKPTSITDINNVHEIVHNIAIHQTKYIMIIMKRELTLLKTLIIT